MLLISGTIRLPVDKREAARSAMEAMIKGSRAEAGCVAYSFAEDVLVPGLFHLSETWMDRAAFDSHVASPHMQVWRATQPSLGLIDRNLKMYEDAGEPRQL